MALGSGRHLLKIPQHCHLPAILLLTSFSDAPVPGGHNHLHSCQGVPPLEFAQRNVGHTKATNHAVGLCSDLLWHYQKGPLHLELYGGEKR
jgi:hypothetical protein